MHATEITIHGVTIVPEDIVTASTISDDNRFPVGGFFETLRLLISVGY
jgi:hypothetical protein